MGALLLSLLGSGLTSALSIGKTILAFMLNLLGALMQWASKHPLPALAIAVDIVLLAGCAWGYHEHKKLAVETEKVVQLQGNLKASQGVVQTLSGRLRQYSDALAAAQAELLKTVSDNNAAIDRLKKAADAQLAAAQKQSEKMREQRDAYAALAAEQKGQPIDRSGTAEQRIAREEKRNYDFMIAFRKAR